MKVSADVPDLWDKKIKTAMEIEGWETVSAYIRELIKKDLVSKGLLGVTGHNGEEKQPQEVPA